MIDPMNPPHIDTATDAELEEFLLFSIAVAGKHAGRTAASLASWLASYYPEFVSPFSILYRHLMKHTIYTDSGYLMEHMAHDLLAGELARHGFGCYNQRAASFINAVKVFRGIPLRQATYMLLIAIRGIGPKTASFFLAYSGMDKDRVILDTHILAWLHDRGWNEVPGSTPQTDGKYELVASYFREEAKLAGITTLELDKKIWQSKAT